MVQAACKPVGNGGIRVGVQASVEGRESPALLFQNSFSLVSKSRCRPGTGFGGSFSLGEGCYGGSPVRNSRVLRQDFCGAKVFGRLETRPRPVNSKPVLREHKFQDGVPFLHSGLDTPRGLGNVNRSEGCLLPYPDTQVGQEVPSICLEGQNLPIRGPTFWASPCPMGVYQDSQGILWQREGHGISSQSLSGRLVDPCVIKSPMLQAHGQDPFYVPRIGLPDQLEKVRACTQAEIPVSGYDVRHSQLESVSFHSEDRQTSCTVRSSQEFQQRNSKRMGCLVRNHGVDGSPSPARQVAQACSPAAVQVPLVSGFSVVGFPSAVRSPIRESNSSVAVPQLALQRSTDYSPTSAGTDVHRCVVTGMGRTCGSTHSIGPMGSPNGQGTYKSPRTRSSEIGCDRVRGFSKRQTYSCQHRQHNSCLLPQQAGGGEVRLSLNQSGGSPIMVPKSLNQDFRQICPGQTEHIGRRSKQVSYGSIDRMDSGTQYSVTDLGDMAQAAAGPLCHQIQQEAPSLRLSSPRPRSVGDRRSVDSLGGPGRLRLPSFSDSRKGIKKGKGRRSSPNPGSSQMASPVMVSGTSSSKPRSSSRIGGKTKFSGSTKVRRSSCKPKRSAAPRLALVRDALSARGASDSVVNLVKHAHRKGTQGVYKAHWASWSSWCSDNNVLSSDPSQLQLANYLAFLADVRKLSAASIRCHRAAIGTTIRQLGGRSFSDDPLLRDIVRGASLRDAKAPRLFPAWDLFLVLAHLRESPYEPIRKCSLKHLSEKTAFLISLASGRRCSEVHALSGSRIASEADGSVSIRFVTGFLAKNQPSSTQSPPIFIKPLTSILASDDEDRKLCPVRALREYRSRTKSYRSAENKRLFLSCQSHHKDVGCATVSRWLRNTIKAAYVSADGNAALPDNFRAHEIRAWAASLAWAHNIQISKIMDAAYWYNNGTFLDFYLRDTSRLNEDGSRGISSAVVAQQAITSKKTSTPKH